jgi:hypothetical protein
MEGASGRSGGIPEAVVTGANHSSLPSLSLPHGGGAIRGIAEKFGINPVTGTGAMTVLVSTSPGRSGFGPELTLASCGGERAGVLCSYPHLPGKAVWGPASPSAPSRRQRREDLFGQP